MRFLKAIIAAVLVLVAITALSRFLLDGAISPQMAGLAGAMAGLVTWFAS